VWLRGADHQPIRSALFGGSPSVGLVSQSLRISYGSDLPTDVDGVKITSLVDVLPVRPGGLADATPTYELRIDYNAGLLHAYRVGSDEPLTVGGANEKTGSTEQGATPKTTPHVSPYQVVFKNVTKGISFDISLSSLSRVLGGVTLTEASTVGVVHTATLADGRQVAGESVVSAAGKSIDPPSTLPRAAAGTATSHTSKRRLAVYAMGLAVVLFVLGLIVWRFLKWDRETHWREGRRAQRAKNKARRAKAKATTSAEGTGSDAG
jgi:hypothetical protein